MQDDAKQESDTPPRRSVVPELLRKLQVDTEDDLYQVVPGNPALNRLSLMIGGLLDDIATAERAIFTRLDALDEAIAGAQSEPVATRADPAFILMHAQGLQRVCADLDASLRQIRGLAALYVELSRL